MMKTDGLVAEIDINPVIVSSKGAVAADARLILSAREVRTNGKAASPDRSASALEKFRPLFEPKTVAVLGASTRDVAIANTFIRRMKAFGYPGANLSDPSERDGSRGPESLSESGQHT